MYRFVIFFSFLILFTIQTIGVAAQNKIVYIPIDNRPVCLDYPVETVKAAGMAIVTPPERLLSSKNHPGDPEKLWLWLLDQASTADAFVLSTDSLVYGGLVQSRTHSLSDETINQRLMQFYKLKEINPNAEIYLFSSIMRTPRFSAGGVEPTYYERDGSFIFRLTALEDKAETIGLTKQEKLELNDLYKQIPSGHLKDWFERRKKNVQANLQLIKVCKEGLIQYLVIGHDDSAEYSQSRREGRMIASYANGLHPNVYESVSGTDELGMILLSRAINGIRWQWPTIAVVYGKGTGKDTIPSYSDQPVGEAVRSHIFAAGAIPLLSPAYADLVLMINTPFDGKTKEANSPYNLPLEQEEIKMFVAEMQNLLQQNKKIVLADISYANGADNALMYELEKQHLLFSIEAYSGWNTPNNSIGFAIGQGVLASQMSQKQKNSLLFTRYLDDWGYQANIRNQLVAEVLIPNQGDYFAINQLGPTLEAEIAKRMDQFVKIHFKEISTEKYKLFFPWNRMFEIKVQSLNQ